MNRLAPLNAPMPALEPLKLLYVTNGSPLTAERWWQAHHYYQHRQNLHYQSLHQSGIVRGLGVRAIAAPEAVSSEASDRRWVEIQPGLAIDWIGNPIVILEPISFRITATVIDKPITVYVVLAYVDPKAKQWQGVPADVVNEEFRINERTTPPSPDEVELCRVQLTPQTHGLHNAAHVMSPATGALDLRYRQPVQPRSQQMVQVGLLDSSPDSPMGDGPDGPVFDHRWTALLQALNSLYPALAGSTQIVSTLEDTTPTVEASPDDDAAPAAEPVADLGAMTILALPYNELATLAEPEIERLQQAIARGSTLVVEYLDDTQDNLPPLGELQGVQDELHNALADLETAAAESELGHIRAELTSELAGCEATLQERLAAIAAPLQHLMPLQDRAMANPIAPMDLTTSPLTQTPFLFDELPNLPSGPVQLMAWDGIVLVLGPLSAAWTRGQFERPLPRSTLRSAQELGINILQQASWRQQLLKAQQPAPPEETAP